MANIYTALIVGGLAILGAWIGTVTQEGFWPGGIGGALFGVVGGVCFSIALVRE